MAKPSIIRRMFKWLVILGVVGVLGVVAVGGVLYYRIAPDLPPVDALRDVQLQIPLRVYTAEGDLIAEYGEKRREPVRIDEVPQSLKDAIIAAEDKRFYTHPGVDWQSLVRAFVNLARTGEKGQGGSTITMQVARNFFLSNEKTYSRKINEIFLSLRIETELTKDEILELYLNKIYLGNRSYGFAAASRVYYGKDIADINVVESAMLAGLPKAPSRYNPIVNPSRALLRRDYVLGRMADLGMIDSRTYNESLEAPVTAKLHVAEPEAEAHYVGEMARARIRQLYGDQWATAGLNVYTTISGNAQRAANKALRSALFAYEKRHGYTGAVGTIDTALFGDVEAITDALDEYPTYGDLNPAVVISVTESEAQLLDSEGNPLVLGFADVEWARTRIDIETMGDEVTAVSEVLQPGDVILTTEGEGGAVEFVQNPAIEGAFVAMAPKTGAITALVGGFDFNRSKFNRVTQARRQPGSTFKPFIYSAALEKSDTAATVYNDAPVVFHDAALEGEWRPSNYSGRFYGPTRLREALVKSRNLVSVRVLREIGIPYAIDYATRFGFKESNMPPDLSLSLGSASVSPLEVANAFAVFANGGYRVTPHFISRIEGPEGELIYQAPAIAMCEDCDPATTEELENEIVINSDSGSGEIEVELEPAGEVQAPRVIEARNAYIMQSIMREVVSRGTARKAAEALERRDLAGKTGTTNNQLDAWFSGFNDYYVSSAWVGSDQLDPLGRGESGGVVALPMWISFMGSVMDGLPEVLPAEPAGITTVRIDAKSGEPTGNSSGSMLEIFRSDRMPGTRQASGTGGESVATSRPSTQKKQEIRETKKKVESLF